jgi:hypothetical protein
MWLADLEAGKPGIWSPSVQRLLASIKTWRKASHSTGQATNATMGHGLIPMTSSNPRYSQRPHLQVHLHTVLGISFQNMNFWGTPSNSSKKQCAVIVLISVYFSGFAMTSVNTSVKALRDTKNHRCLMLLWGRQKVMGRR